MFTFSNNSQPVSFEFNGEGAAQTILQGGTTYPSNVQFASSTSTSDSLSLSFNNLGLDNFTSVSSGGLINLDGTDRHGVVLSFDKCNISRLMARQGALVMCKSQTSITITNSYIEAMKTIDNGWIGGAIEMQRGDLTIINCVFNGNYIDRESKDPGTNRDAGSIAHLQPSQGVINATIINNTIIADSVINSESNDKMHAAFAIIANATNAFNATIANNIFIGAMTDNATYLDIYFSAATNVNLTNSTNNVMNSQSGFVEVGNVINPAYTYTSTEVDFTMDGDTPKLFSSATGVNYVIADGTAVKGQGLYVVDTIPTTDIIGTTRSTTAPWVGAYEEEDAGEPTALFEGSKNAVTIYPNPASDALYINGGVAKVVVYSITGRMVQSTVLEASSIDISGLPNGVYFVKCQDESGATIATQRLIKE